MYLAQTLHMEVMAVMTTALLLTLQVSLTSSADCLENSEDIVACTVTTNEPGQVTAGVNSSVGELHVIKSDLQYITSLSSGQALPLLTDLYMINDNIRFLADDAFENVNNLRKLMLANNSISSLSNNTFRGLSQLSILDLTGNCLYELGASIFSGQQLPALENLHLSRSRIYKLSPTTFTDLRNLAYLDLDNNLLDTPPKLQGCKDLMSLDLSHNNIYNLSGSPFQSLTSLKILDLQYNDITRVNAESFSGLSSLEHLYLQRNRLSTLEDHSLQSLSNLMYLDVSWNNLDTVDKSTVLLPNVATLKLHTNRWTCDCSIAWLREEAIIREFNPEQSMVCAAPSTVSKQSVYLPSLAAFDCSQPHGFHSNTVALAVGLIFAIVVIVVGSFVLYRMTTRKKIRRHAGSPSSNSPYSRVLFEGDSGNI